MPNFNAWFACSKVCSCRPCIDAIKASCTTCNQNRGHTLPSSAHRPALIVRLSIIKETATHWCPSSLSSLAQFTEGPSFLDVDRFRAGDSGTPEGALLFRIGHLAADGDML